MNGAAARLVHPGDKVIILTYHDVPEEETRNVHPIVVNVDEKNNITNSILEDLAL
jgi:aspartate 1-decarboxylase